MTGPLNHQSKKCSLLNEDNELNIDCFEPMVEADKDYNISVFIVPFVWFIVFCI